MIQEDYHAKQKRRGQYSFVSQKVCPFVAGVLSAAWRKQYEQEEQQKGRGDETHQISTVRVKFTAVIGGLKVYVHLIDVSGEEDIRRGTEDLNRRECARGQNASTMTWFGAVGHCFRFHIANSLVLIGRRPQAEICHGR